MVTGQKRGAAGIDKELFLCRWEGEALVPARHKWFPCSGSEFGG